MFDVIRNIIGQKRKRKLNLSDGFSPYVAQRYISFNLIDDRYMDLLNENVNTNRFLHDHPQFFHDYCLKMFPPVARNFLEYTKSDKTLKEKKLDNFNECATDLGISRKDLREYLEIDPTILDKYNQTQELFKVKNRK